jgi:hypothetical protein
MRWNLNMGTVEGEDSDGITAFVRGRDQNTLSLHPVRI